MSQTIDSRVVEMKFDNKNFEKNVAESMKTLEELDKRLTKLEQNDVQLDGIKKAFEGFDLSKVDKALDSITNRFSVLGQVGASVIHNLTTDAYNLVKTFSSNVWNSTFGQIKSGGQSRARNIAEAQFRIEGLGLNYDDYYKSIDDAVTGTAYGFDEAAVAASQFASSGVQAGKDMDDALRSISGMAAMTGRSYTDLASVMEDAAAAGKVTNDTFSRLSERGLAALQEYAKRTNQTVDNVRKAAKAGEISFIEFARVMNEAYGEHATKADDTFTGVTSNIRAQLSRIGQAFYEPLITNNSDLVEMLKSVKKQIKAIKEYTDPLAKSMANYVLKLSRWGKGVIDSIDVSKVKPFFDNLVTIFNNLTVAAENLYTNVLKPFGTQFKAAFYEVFPSLNTGKGLIITISDKIVELSERFRKFTADIGLFGAKGLAVKDVLVGIFSVIKLGITVLKNVVGVIKSVLGAIGQLTGGLPGAISGLSSFITIAANIGYNIVTGIGVGLTYGISAIMGVIVNIGHAIVDAFCKFFGIHSPSRLMITMVGIPIVLGIAAGILKGFPEVQGAIQTVLGGLIGIIGGIITTVVSGVSNIVTNVFTALFNTITGVINAFAEAVSKINVDKLDKILSFIKNVAIVGAELFILFKVVSAVDAFARAANNFAAATKSVARALELFAAQFTIKRLGEMFGKFANIFKNFAIMIAVLTGSIVIFATMWKNGYMYELIGALGVVMLLAASMTVLIKEITKIDADQLKSAALTLVGFGAAMWAMATGIKKLGKMEWYEILTAVVAMGAVLGGLAYLAYKLRDGEAWYSQINYKLILAFAAGVWLIAGSIRRLGKMPLAEILKGEIAILALIAVFGAISSAIVAASKLTTGELADNNFTQLALAFVAFGIAIKMIAKTVIALGFIKADKLDQGMLAISKIMRLMAALMLAAHFLSAEVTAFFVGMTAMVAVMAAAIKVIGDMKTGVKQGLGSLSLIMIEIGAFIKVLDWINPDFKVMKSLAFVAALLGVMTATVKVLGEMDYKQLLQGAAALTGIIAVLTVIIYLWSKFTGLINGQNTFSLYLPDKQQKKKQEDSKKALKEKIKYIKTIVHAVAELAIVAAGIGKLVKSPKEIAVGIGFIIASFAAIMVSVNSIGKIGGDKDKSLKGMASAIRAIALVILSLGGTLILLSNMPIEGMIAGAIAIGGILWVIGKQIIERAKVFGVQGIDPKAIYASVAIIIAIGAAMTALTYVARDSSPWLVLAVAGAISLCIVAIGAALDKAKEFKLDPKTGKALLLAATSLIAVAAAIAIIAQFEWDDYSVGLGAALGCVAAIGLIISLMSKYGGKKLGAASTAILIASLSLVAVGAAIGIIAQFKWEDYRNGLIAAAVCVAALGLVAMLIGKFGGGNAIAGAASMAIVAGAMIVAAGSIAILAQFKWDDYKEGLLGMSVALGLLTAVAGIISYFTMGVGVIAGATAMVLVAAAMGVAAVSLAVLSNYKWEDFGESLIAMGVALSLLSAIAAVIAYFTLGVGVVAGAAAMAIVAASMCIAAGSIAILSNYAWEDYGDSLLHMSIALGVLTLVAGAVSLFTGAGMGAIAGAAAMAIVAGAMCVAAASLAILATFNWEDIQSSLIGVTVALGVLSIIAGIIGGLAGTGAVAGAAAIAIIAGAIAVLAIAFTSLATALMDYFTPEKAEQIVAFFSTLSDGIPSFAESLSANLEQAVATLREHVPPLKEEISKLVDDIADSMTELAQQIETRGTEVVNAMGDMCDAIKAVIKERFGINSPSKFMADIGMWLMKGLAHGIAEFATAPVKTIVNAGKTLIDKFRDVVGVHSESTVFFNIGKWLMPGVAHAIEVTKPLLFKSAESAGSGLVDSFKEGAKDLLDGSLSGSIGDALNDVFANLDIDALKSGDISGLLGGLLQNGVSLDALGGDSLTALINKLKEAGIEGNGLNDILKALGISADQLKDLGLSDALGLDEAKDGAEELKTTIEDLADEIIKGNFGNAPERWDRMFESLIKSGKTAEEAYAAIADAQNEVNKRLGNSTVHTAEEMEKKVSDSVKKANEAAAKANEGKKEPRDFTKDPYKATPLTAKQKADVASAADQQMMNNMPYENYKAIKAGQVTKEYEKQTAEAYKQKLANEHIYSLKEKENALAAIAANNKKIQSTGVTDEARKQLEAENQRYQKVVDTYNTQREMIKAIEEQETATKKAEAAEKKRGEAIKAAEGAVVYGSAEYYKQTGKTGTTINNQAARPETKKAAPQTVQTEVKAEANVTVEAKTVDATQLKSQIETTVKDLQTKVEITPQINTAQAETQIKNFKSKTEELKTSIPQTFNGIAEKVSTHISQIANKISSEGGKISENTKKVFQKAVDSATSVLTSSSTIDRFYKAGKQATDGYVRGLKANLSAVKAAASEIANASANATKKTLKEKSPSRVFIGIGGYAGEGYVIGLRQYSGAVEAASSEMAQSSIDGVYRVVDAVQNAVNEGMDITPTITPVFDSANVQNEIGSVNSMMDLSNRDLASISANIDAKASYDNSQVEEMQNRMDTMRTAFNDLAEILMNQPTPEVNANVVLQGDAAGVFKLVRNENTVYTKMHGKSALA